MTRTVPVGDMVALVDADDYALVAAHRWRPAPDKNGVIYAQANTSRRDGPQTTVRMHRIIMDAPKGVQVDHVNHDGLDNRRSNLRLATQTQNNANRRMMQTNTSGRKGVCWNGRNWQAAIRIDGVQTHLGYFVHLDDAAAAYDKAATEHLGEYALTNQMLGHACGAKGRWTAFEIVESSKPSKESGNQ